MRRTNLDTAEALRWKREFGHRLRESRTARDMSQEQLAHAANVHRTYIGAVERGEQNISLVLIHQIAGALEVTPATLLTPPDRPPLRTV